MGDVSTTNKSAYTTNGNEYTTNGGCIYYQWGCVYYQWGMYLLPMGMRILPMGMSILPMGDVSTTNKGAYTTIAGYAANGGYLYQCGGGCVYYQWGMYLLPIAI